MDLEAMKAAYLAKGGKVTQVAEGEGAGLTDADWREALRTPGKFDARRLGGQIAAEDEYERRAEMAAERAREESGYYKS